ncbi:MAG TPA: lysophospholipid acyltransferase family protein, partial [Victivallales bacterium]|nr:lysophospholipid acyltransferase family protein [Victivallales bacterium]
LGVKFIDKICKDFIKVNTEPNVAETILTGMNVKYEYLPENLEKIPKNGPLIIVANHPYGGIEGIILLALLKKVRPDVRLMTSFVLGTIPYLSDYFILVDSFDRKNSLQNNFKSMRKISNWLKKGGLLGIFPAGEVSGYVMKEHKVTDRAWSQKIGSLILKSKCDVQCVYFNGRNSNLSILLGFMHSFFRTLWVPRELKRICNRTIHLKIGDLITAETLKSYKSPCDLVRFLRYKTYSLNTKDNNK